MSRTTVVCQGALDHRPLYAETDRHHVRPKYLSALLGLAIEPRVVPLCSGCHDLAHHVLHHLINTGTRGGHRLPKGLAILVDDAWNWWQQSLLDGR